VLTFEQTEELVQFLDPAPDNAPPSICCLAPECLHEVNLPSDFAEMMVRLEDKAEFSITKSGYYFVFAVNCQHFAYKAEGQVTVVNPYGYVPGLDGKLLYVRPKQFYPILTLLYCLHCGLWLVGLLRHYKSTVNIQRLVIPSVLVLGFLEAALKTVDLWVYNSFSERNVWLSALALIAVCMRGALARILVLVVCKGWGVVSDKLSGHKKASVLGLFYFVIALLYYKIRQQIHGQGATLTLKHTFMSVSVPLSLIDSVFFSWTLYSLSQTKLMLETERQTYKLGLFRTLTVIMYSAIALALVILFSEGYDVSQLSHDGVWQRIWMYEASWNLVFWVVLVGVTFLWRPSPNSHLLATTQQIVSEDIDLEFESAEDQSNQIEMSSTLKPNY
jgi:hypothetical protein